MEKQFKKHILLPEIGHKGQEKIIDSKILIIGLGGIGCPLTRYLASSGVGYMGLIDDDIIEEDNLPRQNNYLYADIDKAKVDISEKILKELNPNIQITKYYNRANEQLLDQIIGNYDLVIDASDNFKTKFLANKLSHKYNKIFLSGSFSGFKGYAATYKSGINKELPCFACFHNQNVDSSIDKSCFRQGVLSAGVGVVGTFLASEAIKEIISSKYSMAGKIMIFDFIRNNHRMVKLPKKDDCLCN